MSKYEVKDVVCDYGLYEDGELKLILNSKQNALTIKTILEVDEFVHNQEDVCNIDEISTEKIASNLKNAMDTVIDFLHALSDENFIKRISVEIAKEQVKEKAEVLE